MTRRALAVGWAVEALAGERGGMAQASAHTGVAEEGSDAGAAGGFISQSWDRKAGEAEQAEVCGGPADRITLWTRDDDP